MSLLAKSKGEVTYKDLTSLHKWALVVLISMGSSIIYAPMYLKNVFYDPLMQALGCTNADLGLMVSAYGIAAMICYLPSGIVADKFRMRTLATVGFLATAVLVGIYAMLPSVEICLVLFVAMGITSILVWWGTRFKVIRLCCEEDEYASKIGISYSIYGVTGLVIGLINAGIIAAIANVAQGVQVMLIFLAVVIAVLGVASIFLIPDFKGEIDKNAKLFSLKEAVEAIKHPGVIWACVAYFACYAVYQGATYTTPYLTQCFNADGNLVNIVGLIRTIDHWIKGGVDFPAIQNIPRLLVNLIADAVHVIARRGNEKIEGLLSGVAGAVGHDIIELPVWLGVQLVKYHRMDVEAMLGVCLCGKYLIEAPQWLIEQALLRQHRLDTGF